MDDEYYTIIIVLSPSHLYVMETFQSVCVCVCRRLCESQHHDIFNALLDRTVMLNATTRCQYRVRVLS